jgi:hypothetical protein
MSFEMLEGSMNVGDRGKGKLMDSDVSYWNKELGKLCLKDLDKLISKMLVRSV